MRPGIRPALGIDKRCSAAPSPARPAIGRSDDVDRAHNVERVEISGDLLILVVDGGRYEIRFADQSTALARATDAQRRNFVLSPTGYGIHWPDIDEDLSIDGLIGVKHKGPLAESPSQ